MQTANIGQRPAPPLPPTFKPQPSAAPNTSVSNASIPQPAPAPEVEVIPPAAPPAPPAPPEPEPVIQAEDIYIPFEDHEQRKTAEEIEKGVRDIHNALDRLLKHERDGRGLLATPDPYTRSVRNLARHARELLDDWLDDRNEKEARTITIDALN